MSITAIIEETNRITTFPDPNGGETYSTTIWISIIDAVTGQYANGNNCEVTFQLNQNGSLTTNTVIVPGQSVKIFGGKVRESRYNAQGQQIFSSYKAYSILSVKGGSSDPLPNPGVCDLNISFVNIDKPESAVGASDGQITINASSSYGPIQYSNNAGATWQLSPTFTGLSGGLMQPLVKDSNPLGCTAQAVVSIPTISSLLVADPSVTLIGDNISRWNATFNPIVFTYQRKDFGIISITQDNEKGYAKIAVNTSFIDPVTSKYKVNPGDKVYLAATPYQGVYEVDKVGNNNEITIITPFNGAANGHININSMRPYYQVITRITYQDKLTGRQNIITSTNRPNNEGIIKADLSNFLQSLLRPDDSNDYTQPNFRDDNLSASYQVAYAEHYDDGTTEGYTSAFTALPHPFYIVYAAKQLGDRYGGNLAAYVPFRIADPSQLARWITDFAEPSYSIGYPFDIGFIYSEDLIGVQLYCAITLYDINRNPLPGGPQTSYLLNEDGSWLLNQDGSKFIIANQTQVNTPIPAQLGLNRLRINNNFPREVYYINIALKYDDEHTTHTVTKTQTIKIDDTVDYNSVYLRWIGLSGSTQTRVNEIRLKILEGQMAILQQEVNKLKENKKS